MTTLDVTTTKTPQAFSGAVFATTRAQLADALRTVGLAVPPRPSVPVLSGVLLEADQGDLVVSGFDYENGVVVRIPDAVTTPGRLLVCHAELLKLVAALTHGAPKRDADLMPVRLRALDAGWAAIEAAGTVIPLEFLPLEDYPRLPEAPPVLARMERERFTAEAMRVLRAAGRDPKLPGLTGMNIDVSAYGVTLAATDRYRLAVGHAPAHVDLSAAPPHGLLIDGRLLKTVLPKLAGSEITVGCTAGTPAPLVSLSSGAVSVLTRCIDSEFPAYTSLLSRTVAATVVAERAALATQTRRAAAVLGAKGHKRTPVALTVDGASVTVAPDLIEGAHHMRTPAIPAEVHGINDPLWVRFTPAFLAEALETFTGASIALHLTAATKPMLLTDTIDGRGDPTAFCHLLMPICLRN